MIANIYLKIPIYAVNNTDIIPTMKLEDGELKYFCAKIEKLEAIVARTQETVNILVSLLRRAIEGDDSQVLKSVASTLLPSVHGIVMKSASTTNKFAFTPEELHVNNTDLQQHAVPSASQSQTFGPTASSLLSGDAICGNTSTVVNDDIRARWADRLESTSSGAAAVETNDTTSGRDNNDHDDDFTIVENRRKNRLRRKRSQSQSPVQIQTEVHHVLADKNSYATAVTSGPKKAPKKPLVAGTQRSPASTASTSTVNSNMGS